MADQLGLLQDMGIQFWVQRQSAEVMADADIKPIKEALATTEASLDPLIENLNWAELETHVAQCQMCPLHQQRARTVFGAGSQQARWLIIGEAPGREEDKQGAPFVGRAGQLLNAMLQAINVSREDVYISNAVKCRPPNNRTPEQSETTACLPYLQAQIKRIQPDLIILLGKVAAQQLLQTDETIAKLRGQIHDYQNIPTLVSYHPAYLLRRPIDKAKSWQDLQLALDTVKPH
jgi:DNA polymerase